MHSDWWSGTGAQLATCNRIAVYPVTGWWREQSHLKRFTKKARYSLIVELEAPGVEVDLYTSIAADVELVTSVEAM